MHHSHGQQGSKQGDAKLSWACSSSCFYCSLMAARDNQSHMHTCKHHSMCGHAHVCARMWQAAKAQEQQLEGLRQRLQTSTAEANAASAQAAAARAQTDALADDKAKLQQQLEAVMEGARQVRNHNATTTYPYCVCVFVCPYAGVCACLCMCSVRQRVLCLGGVHGALSDSKTTHQQLLSTLSHKRRPVSIIVSTFG